MYVVNLTGIFCSVLPIKTVMHNFTKRLINEAQYLISGCPMALMV